MKQIHFWILSFCFIKSPSLFFSNQNTSASLTAIHYDRNQTALVSIYSFELNVCGADHKDHGGNGGFRTPGIPKIPTVLPGFSLYSRDFHWIFRDSESQKSAVSPLGHSLNNTSTPFISVVNWRFVALSHAPANRFERFFSYTLSKNQ
jgi:hypothetical protein